MDLSKSGKRINEFIFIEERELVDIFKSGRILVDLSK